MTQDIQQLKMPPTVPSFCKHHLREQNEDYENMVPKDIQHDLLKYNDDYVEMLPGKLMKFDEDIECETNKTFCEQNVCNENCTNVQSGLKKIKDTTKERSDEDEYVSMNGKNTSLFESFNEQYYDVPRNSFSSQCRQWLNSPEKDLFLNAGFIAQTSRRKQTQNRNSLCFYWLNTADNKLFLNTAFAAKSSRRRHTR